MRVAGCARAGTTIRIRGWIVSMREDENIPRRRTWCQQHILV